MNIENEFNEKEMIFNDAYFAKFPFKIPVSSVATKANSSALSNSIIVMP